MSLLNILKMAKYHTYGMIFATLRVFLESGKAPIFAPSKTTSQL